MKNPALADPEGDVRRLGGAVGDQIAWPEIVIGDRGSSGLLLVGVSGNEAPDPAIGHVDEAGAVDTALGHATPEIGRAQIAARLLDGVASGAAQIFLTNPAEIVVGGLDARPAVAKALDRDGLAAQKLRHALGVVARLSAHSGDVHRAEHVHSG